MSGSDVYEIFRMTSKNRNSGATRSGGGAMATPERRMSMPSEAFHTNGQDVIAAVRAFNRFWTKTIGVLNASLLDSEYSLTEVRVLFEITHESATTLTELRDVLGIDSGYLSRILSRFKSETVIKASPSEEDARRQVLTLTRKGRSVMAELDERASKQVRELLGVITPEEQQRLVAAMSTIRRLLDRDTPPEPCFVIRHLRRGDIGWVLERHGALYSAEHHFDEEFEALVAQILAGYAMRRDQKTESAWIAEVEGKRVGSIFCMRRSAKVAQLRLLLVEPRARRMGIGTKLVEECIEFARRVGYQQMMLWTKDNLHDARRIYERHGFIFEAEDENPPRTGQPRGQTWRLAL
jgi:DNA-binding MarR family transcriptional regulator/GNAT superfamily N-acetyltransferase